MPVGRNPDARKALLVALAGVVAAFGLVGTVVLLSGNDGTSPSSGAFPVGGVDTLIDAQARDRVPLCLNDPANADRPVCVFHVGEVDDVGWLAYDAQIDGCVLDIDVEAQALVACDGERHPFTGVGLPDYPTRVEDGRVVVNLSGEEFETTTTTTILVTGG